MPKRIFKEDWKGTGWFAAIARELNKYARFLNNFAVMGDGYFIPNPRNPTVFVNNSHFTGTAYVSGIKITGLASDVTKKWVSCKADGTATEQAGPAPDPFPADEEWFEKSHIYGDLHAWHS
jgi:hypothetical protein